MQSYSLKSKQRKKSNQSSISSERSVLNERLAFEAVSRELQVLRLREILVLSGFIIGAAGLRAAMQFLPSIEPLTFFAMLSGFLFGKKKGFIAGASSLYLSNFLVFGGQGPWTLFQALGFGIAGFLGGFLKGNPGRIGKAALFAKVIFISLISTVLFEVIMNLSSIPIYGWIVFLTAIPFSIAHIASNLVFASAIPNAAGFVSKKFGFERIPACRKLAESLKSRLENNIKEEQ